jgi:L-fucose isomerase-like protein
MNSLKKDITLHMVAFSSVNYWKDENQLQFAEQMLDEIEKKLASYKINCSKIVVTRNDDIAKLENNNQIKGQPALFFPMSGATQEFMLKTSSIFNVLGIGITYTDFFINKSLADRFLVKNAAPAAMDIYAVLKRNKKEIKLFSDLEEVIKRFISKRAIERLNNSTLLRIGDTEPWVISSTKDIAAVKNKLGVNLISILQSELEDEFKTISESEIDSVADDWLVSASDLVDVKKTDIIEAAKLMQAVRNMVKKYDADGVSMACFNLLHSLGTTACLAVSVLNDDETLVGGCEGDVDSALTLMLLKALTGKSGWVANPMIEHNNLLRLAHCTAPRYNNFYKYQLMRHHESGIGVSNKVFLPSNERVTLARLGNNLSSINIFSGITYDTDTIETCRTQLLVKLDDFNAYKEKVLGCHQVLVFGDYNAELQIVADMLKLKY